jgi:hypothetical protein
LDANGDPLADQSKAWNASGSEATFDQWPCVKDNVTGLIWETKTTSGLQSSAYTYTWYNSTGINDGGNAGFGDTGIGTTTDSESGSDNCADGARCDTEKYATDVNLLDICGETNNDWRLPNKNELASLVEVACVRPAINTSVFPAYILGGFWSSSPSVATQWGAWDIAIGGNGGIGIGSKNFPQFVQLVRGVATL